MSGAQCDCGGMLIWVAHPTLLPGGGVVLDQETRCGRCEIELGDDDEADVYLEESADVYHATPDCERAECAEETAIHYQARAHAIPCFECFSIDE